MTLGITTFCKMAPSIMTCSLTTFSMMALGIITFSIKNYFVTFNINWCGVNCPKCFLSEMTVVRILLLD
jgi:hypothetical protein